MDVAATVRRVPRPADAEAWGVQTEFVDAWGQQRRAPESSVDAVLEAMGATREGPPTALGAAREGSPPRCPLPSVRAWGWAAQLYATRSTASWGIGDRTDLECLAVWAGEQ